ncbi:hypothetical protein Tco_1484092 [Tanacetum coccineum]
MLSWRGKSRFSALWRDVYNRVIMKASHTSAANNNTVAQGPSSPHGERSFLKMLVHLSLLSTWLSTCEPSFSNSAFDEGPSTSQPSSSNAEHLQSDFALDEGRYFSL